MIIISNPDKNGKISQKYYRSIAAMMINMECGKKRFSITGEFINSKEDTISIDIPPVTKYGLPVSVKYTPSVGYLTLFCPSRTTIPKIFIKNIRLELYKLGNTHLLEKLHTTEVIQNGRLTEKRSNLVDTEILTSYKSMKSSGLESNSIKYSIQKSDSPRTFILHDEPFHHFIKRKTDNIRNITGNEVAFESCFVWHIIISSSEMKFNEINMTSFNIMTSSIIIDINNMIMGENGQTKMSICDENLVQNNVTNGLLSGIDKYLENYINRGGILINTRTNQLELIGSYLDMGQVLFDNYKIGGKTGEELAESLQETTFEEVETAETFEMERVCSSCNIPLYGISFVRNILPKLFEDVIGMNGFDKLMVLSLGSIPNYLCKLCYHVFAIIEKRHGDYKFINTGISYYESIKTHGIFEKILPLIGTYNNILINDIENKSWSENRFVLVERTSEDGQQIKFIISPNSVGFVSLPKNILDDNIPIFRCDYIIR